MIFCTGNIWFLRKCTVIFLMATGECRGLIHLWGLLIFEASYQHMGCDASWIPWHSCGLSFAKTGLNILNSSGYKKFLSSLLSFCRTWWSRHIFFLSLNDPKFLPAMRQEWKTSAEQELIVDSVNRLFPVLHHWAACWGKPSRGRVVVKANTFLLKARWSLWSNWFHLEMLKVLHINPAFW